MKHSVSILGSIVSVVVCTVLSACGGASSGSGSGGSNTPQTNVTSVSVAPPTPVTLYTGTTQQFTVTVAGTGQFSTAVTWSVVAGNGTVSSAGLFTAPGTPETDTVMAASQEDPSVTGSTIITVQSQPVAFGNWHGTLVSSDGTQTLPIDFSLTRTGNALSTTNGRDALVISSTSQCANFDLSNADKIGSDLFGGSNLAGTISGQNVTMTFTPTSETTAVPISLTGTLSQDGSTISGTFSKTAYGCFANVTSGTFSFAQYAVLPPASGTFMWGTTSVPFSLGNAGITVGAIAATNCPASTYPMLSEQEGRFFHLWEESVASNSTPLVVWGLANNPTDATLDTFVVAQLNGYGGTTNPCFEPLSPLETTLTATP